MGHNVRLIVPTQNEDELAPIIGRILGRYGGVTVSHATRWYNPGEAIPVKDKVSVLECSIGQWTEQVRTWWHVLAETVRQEWKQKSVFLSVSEEHAGVKTGPISFDFDPIV